MIKRLLKFFAPYQVVIENWYDFSVIIHKATNYREALAWSSCYPNEVTVSINRYGKRVATVGQR